MATDTLRKRLLLSIEADVKDKGVKEFGDSVDKVASSAEKTSAKTKILDGALTAIGFNAVDVGLKLGKMAFDFVGDSIKKSAEFEQSLANVAASAKLSQTELDALRQEALRVGKDTSKSASEAADAFGELVKAGQSVADVVAGVGDTTVKLAEATGISVSNAATLISDTMTTFKIASGDASKASDTLARAAAASTIDVGQIGQTLAAVGPVASQAGLSLEQFGTATGLLANNALKGSDAGTSLKTLLLNLQAPTDKAAALMQNLGIQVYDANGKTRDFRDILGNLESSFKDLSGEDRNAAMREIFGTDAIRAANILVSEGVAGWDKFTQSMNDMPSVAQMTETRLNTLSGQMEQFRGSVETIQIMIGSKFLPVLKDMAAVGVKALNWLIDGSVISAIGRAGDALKDLIPADTIDRISGLTAVPASIGKSLDAIRDLVVQFADWFGDHWRQIWDAVEPVVRPVVDQLANILGLIADTVTGTFQIIEGILTGDWERVWEGVKTIVGGVKDYLVDSFKNIVDLITGSFGLIKDVVVNVGGAAWTWISDNVPTWPGKIAGFLADTGPKVTEKFSEAKQGAIDALGNAWDWIQREIPTWPGKIGGFLGNLGDIFCEPFHRAANAVQNWLGGAAGWMAAELPTWPGKILGALGNLADAFCGVAKNMASGFVSALGNLPSGIARAMRAAAGPINQFIDLVNTVLDKLGVPKLPTLGGISDPGGVSGGETAGSVSVAAGAWGAITGPIQASCFAEGGMVGGLTAAIMGEDGARWPEYVIPTHPRSRDRARALLADAGARLGGIGGVGDLIGGIWGGLGDLIAEGAASAVKRMIHAAGVDFSHIGGLAGDIAQGSWSALTAGLVAWLDKIFAKKRAEDSTWRRPLSGYTVTQEFGENPAIYGPGGHTGIDLAAPLGSSIFSARGGRTSYAGWLDPRGTGGYGNAVIVQHLDNISTLYGHMSEILTRIDSAVGGGETIGRVGSTGFSTGPHLHFETRVGGAPVNPRQFLSFGNGGIVSQRLILVDPETGDVVGEIAENGEPEAIVPLNDQGKAGGLGKNDQGKPGKFILVGVMDTTDWPTGFGEGFGPGKFTNPGRQNTEGWTTVGGEGRSPVINADTVEVTADGTPGNVVIQDVKLTDMAATFGEISRVLSKDVSITENLMGFLGLSKVTTGGEWNISTINANEALRRATGGRSGEEIMADFLSMTQAARAAWQAAINYNAMFQNTALNPASITAGMTPEQVNEWLANQRAAEVAAFNAAQAAKEAAKEGQKAGTSQTQAAQTQAEAAQTQAEAAGEMAQTAAVEEDRATVAADHADKAALDAQAAADTHGSAAGVMKDAADTDSTAASDFIDGANEFGVQVGSFAEAIDAITAPPEGPGQDYQGGPDDTKKPTPSQSGSGQDPNVPDPTQHAGGGFVYRPTLLMDAETGHIWGSMSEPGTGGEWIVNQAQMAALHGGAAGSRLQVQNQILLMPPDPDAYRRHMREQAYLNRVRVGTLTKR